MDGIYGGLPQLVLWVVLVAYALRPVSRARLERFARRQALPITAANGPMILGYLATTRRWRIAGLVVGAVVSFGFNVTQRSSGQVGAGFVLGWFVGALVAEWRMQTRAGGTGRRTAMLVARRFSDYVPRILLTLDAVAWVAAIGLASAALIVGKAPTTAVYVGLVLSLLAVPATWLVGRRVLNRPQPVAEYALLEADDALRSRSLHVLAGSILALNGIVCGLSVSASLVRPGTHDWMSGEAVEVTVLLGAVMLPIIGFLAATSPFSTQRRLAGTPGQAHA